MKCPECGKNMVEEISSRLKTINLDGIIMRLENPGFEWRCKCGYTQDWQEEALKIISLPCPDCEGAGHISLGFKKELWYPLIEEQGQTTLHLVIKHCPRCKGSGEVVQE